MGETMQASGHGAKGASDGVNDRPGGKTAGGESGGGGYPDGHEDGREDKSGPLGTGGQTLQEYHGGADGVARDED